MRTTAVADRVVVELEARTARYDAQIARSAATFDRNMGRMTAASARFAAIGVGAIAGGAALTAIAAVRLATSESVAVYTRLQNRLKAVGLEGQELRNTFQALSDISMRHSVPIESLGQLYQRLGIAQKALGTSSQEMLLFTDRVAGSLRLQGTSATQARGALIQLTQAVGAGIVRAEEFNSIAEGALPILQAVARGLREAGGDVAALRRLVVDGKVSSQAFFRAFLAGSQDLDKQLKTQTLTVEQAHTRLSNALVKTVGEFDKATGASSAYARTLGWLANQISSVGTAIENTNRRYGGSVFDMLRTPQAGSRTGQFAGFGGDPNTNAALNWTPQVTRNYQPVSINDFPVQGKNASRQRLDSYERELRRIRETTQELRAEEDALYLSNLERTRAVEIAKLENMAKREGITLSPERRAQILAEADAYAQQVESLRRARELQKDMQDLQRQFGNVAINSIEGLVDGTKKWNDVLADSLRLLAQMAARAAILGEGPLAGTFGTSSGSSNIIGGIIGSLFGGAFANGGSTPGNRPILVGERGPELLLPGRAGSIIKNSDLVSSNSSGAPTVIMQNDFRDSSAPAIVAINQRIDRLERNLPNIISRTQSQQRSVNPFYGSN